MTSAYCLGCKRVSVVTEPKITPMKNGCTRVSGVAACGHNVSKIQSKVAGAGVADFFELRSGYPPKMRKFLASHGDQEIRGIVIARKTIEETSRKLMDWISLGSIERNRKRLGYDDLFHLSFELELDDGVYRVEKNQVIMAFKIVPHKLVGSGVRDWISKKMEEAAETDPSVLTYMHLPLKNKRITFAEFMAAGEKSQGAQFFRWKAGSNSCQVFVNTLVKANGLESPLIRRYVLQDAGSILKDAPWVEAAATGSTNVVAWLDRIVDGD